MRIFSKDSRDQKRKFKGVKLKWELLIVFLAFLFFVVIDVWILQLKYLDKFYRKTRHAEIGKAASLITESLAFEETDLRELAFQCAADNNLCIRIFKIVDDEPEEIVSVEGTGACFIHYLGNSDILRYRNKAIKNGGEIFETIELKTTDRIPLPDKKVIPSNDNVKTGEHSEIFTDNGDSVAKDDYANDSVNVQMFRVERQVSNELYIKVLTASDSNGYIVMLDADLMPMNSTVNTLVKQFIWIVNFLVAGTLIMTFVILRTVVKPISDMNEAAKKLSDGEYDVHFPVKGCTETRELASTLNQAALELSKNDNLRKELIANISHDLRTPLTMIRGYTEIMRDIPEENTSENMQLVIDETTMMSDLVNDLLDISKLQSGVRKPILSHFDITETVKEVLSRYVKLVEHDGYSISFSSDCNVYVDADRIMILQVIYNLVNNALNYCGADKAVKIIQSVNCGLVRITVSDNGVGIEPSQIPYIWDRYYKIDKVHKRAAVGTGLGLSIVKHILEQHDASYGVLSTPGAGSAFWFELKISTNSEEN